mmetsp:Transcript_40595/g.45354  ORF Transcript_40595/g.45354 Transcript_40595/m.45354 type:complete len:132 (-) Transcript_40595:73-468(-)
MGADIEAINVELGLQKHVENFYANGAASARRMEEVENVPVQLTNEEVTDTVNQQNSEIDDGWDDDILVDEDEMGDEGRNTEEEVDNDDENVGATVATGATEDNSKTAGTMRENDGRIEKKIKTLSEQENQK